MSDIVELTGDDGTLEVATFGAEVVGDGTKTLAVLGASTGKGYWLITAKATTASLFASFEIGELFPATGNEVPMAGDKAKLVTSTVIADYVSWSAKITGTKIDTTRGIHKFKKTALGKFEFSGSMKGLFTVGITDQAGGFLNRWFKIVTKNANGTIVVAPRANTPLYIRGVVRNSALAGETFEFMWAQIQTFGFNLGAESGNAQSFDTEFGLKGADPVFYVEEITA